MQTAPEVRGEFTREEVAALIPARLRRLSNAEYEASVRVLLDTDAQVAELLPADLEVEGYTRNGSSTVSSTYNARVRDLAERLSRQYVDGRRSQLSCQSEDGSACAEQFISSFAPRALRRPLREDEREALLSIYAQAAKIEGNHAGALAWVISALLQSPSFLYVSEEGEPTRSPRVHHLDSYEIASVLSYMLTGAPPDEELIEAAGAGRLFSAEEREGQARRLLAQSDTRHQFRRFVRQWLEVDGLEDTSKDEVVTPYYEELKPKMLAETSSFVDEVMVHRGASVASLLTAGFSSVDPTMARFYGLSAWGPRVPSRDVGRIGVLQQASFLAAHAHPDGSSPIKRGDFVLRRVLCVEMPRPDEIGIEIVIPTVTETETTRQRFEAHVNNPGCASCHDFIDPLGFAFEHFDAAGHYRQRENSRPVVAKGSFRYEGWSADFDSSVELSEWLARQPETSRCFRKQALTFFAAEASDEHARAFEEVIGPLPTEQKQSLIDNLVAYARSDLFLYRRVKP